MEFRDRLKLLKSLIPIPCKYYDKDLIHSEKTKHSALLDDPDIFRGVVCKEEKDGLLIAELTQYKEVSEALWIIETFENNWLSIYYSNEDKIREKILKSHPEIFIVKKNNKIYCVVNFKKNL
jgi:hypothetical protein